MKERSDFNTKFKNSIEYNVCWKLRMLNKNMQTALSIRYILVRDLKSIFGKKTPLIASLHYVHMQKPTYTYRPARSIFRKT